ncbi:MAG TPA: DUF5069 domain-containing protein [Acidobacteriota bacterium]|nr:DUF5069 domain-containing protein [Acidobacteriota bacterium]
MINDLTIQPPRKPTERLNGFVILGRTIDKCRALLAGKIGLYHYDCPVDNMLFSYKGITAAQLKEKVQAGLSDQQIADWLLTAGIPRSADDIKIWSDFTEKQSSYNNPKTREWFVGACKTVGLDPTKTTLFEYLMADDIHTFAIK